MGVVCENDPKGKEKGEGKGKGNRLAMMNSLHFLQSLLPKISPYPLRSPPTLKLTHPPNTHTFRCTAGSDAGEPPLSGEAVSAMVDELLKKEENRELLDGLKEASRRVERAREAMAEIERRESEAAQAKKFVSQLESRKLEVSCSCPFCV